MQTQGCPSWPKEHDWKSCNASTSIRGFESLALRQIKKEHLHGVLFLFQARDSDQCDMIVQAHRAKQNHHKKVLCTFLRIGYPRGSCPAPNKKEHLYGVLFFRQGIRTNAI